MTVETVEYVFPLDVEGPNPTCPPISLHTRAPGRVPITIGGEPYDLTPDRAEAIGHAFINSANDARTLAAKMDKLPSA